MILELHLLIMIEICNKLFGKVWLGFHYIISSNIYFIIINVMKNIIFQ